MQTWSTLPQQQLAGILEWHPRGLKFACKIIAGPKASSKHHHPWWQDWKGSTSEHPLNKTFDQWWQLSEEQMQQHLPSSGTKKVGLLVCEEPPLWARHVCSWLKTRFLHETVLIGKLLLRHKSDAGEPKTFL